MCLSITTHQSPNFSVTAPRDRAPRNRRAGRCRCKSASRPSPSRCACANAGNEISRTASPPSASYRLRKVVRRNRVALSVVAVCAVALLIAVSGITAGIVLTVRDRAARQERVSGQLELILGEVAKLQHAEKWSEALVSARRMEPALASGDAMPQIEARARQALSDLELVRRVEETRGRSGTAWADPQPPNSAQTERD